MQAGCPGGAQQADVARLPVTVIEDRLQQRQLDDPILDYVAERRLAQAGGIKTNLAEAVLLPHLHLLVGLQAARLDTGPGANLLQDALAGQTQGTDPVVRRIPKRRIGQLPLHDGNLEAALLECGGEPQAHHATSHNHHIHVLHLHHLFLSWLTDRVSRGRPLASTPFNTRFAAAYGRHTSFTAQVGHKP